MKFQYILALLVVGLFLFGCTDLEDNLSFNKGVSNEGDLGLNAASDAYSHYESLTFSVDQSKINYCKQYSTLDKQDNCISELGVGYCEYLQEGQEEVWNPNCFFAGCSKIMVSKKDYCKYENITNLIYRHGIDSDDAKYLALKTCYYLENTNLRLDCFKKYELCDAFKKSQTKDSCLNGLKTNSGFYDPLEFPNANDAFVEKYFSTEDSRI